MKLAIVLLLLTTGCSSNEVQTWVRQGLESKKAINESALKRVRQETSKIQDIIEDDDEEDEKRKATE